MTARRTFLKAILAAGVAPAFVRSSSLMLLVPRRLNPYVYLGTGWNSTTKIATIDRWEGVPTERSTYLVYFGCTRQPCK